MDPRFLTYCAMTCVGGSERKECPCSYPGQCELQQHPQFAQARVDAIRRMAAHFGLPERLLLSRGLGTPRRGDA